jgi:membrane fusion protein, multidrug efflux system
MNEPEQSSATDNKNTPAILNRRTPPHRTLIFWLIILIVILIIGLTRQQNMSKGKNNPNPPMAVVVAVARTMDVPVYIAALGTVTPTYTITVRTQINGQLLQVLYREGQMVKKGDLLAQIDPRPYEAQLVQYQGQYARDQALLANAKLDLKRYQTLWRQNSVAKQTLDTQVSLVAQNEGVVKIDLGQLQATRLNLIYCQITSPINGRIGLRLVDPGNYVQTTDTSGIAVITMLDPITVIFTIPQDNIPAVAKKIYADKTLIAKAYDREQNQLLATGQVLTIDNQIDPTTGTVKIRAEFQNPNNRLFPSEFVNVQLLVDTLKHATVVPTAAIQYSPKGTFVYLLNKDKTVSVKLVSISVTTGNDTTITSGLTAGQTVVTEGTDMLTDGAKVTVADPKKPVSSVNMAANTHLRRFFS